jgi:hypothetical protein
MAAYTTTQLDTIVAQLEAGLGKSYAEITTSDGKHIVYRSVSEIRAAISYFQALYNDASDAPTPTKKVRTYYLYGGNGISQ